MRLLDLVKLLLELTEKIFVHFCHLKVLFVLTFVHSYFLLMKCILAFLLACKWDDLGLKLQAQLSFFHKFWLKMIRFSVLRFKLLLIWFWRFLHQFFFWKVPFVTFFVDLDVDCSLPIISFKYWIGRSGWSVHWSSWLVSNNFHWVRAGVVILFTFVAALLLYRSAVNNYFLNNPWLPFWL